MINKYDDLINICNENPWLSSDEYDFDDYCYSFKEVSTIDELKEVFEQGNWAIRQGFMFNNLAFVQQVDGGDEWLALKNENGEWKSFESISFGLIIELKGVAYFTDYMNKLIDNTIDEYWQDTKETNMYM